MVLGYGDVKVLGCMFIARIQSLLLLCCCASDLGFVFASGSFAPLCALGSFVLFPLFHLFKIHEIIVANCW